MRDATDAHGITPIIPSI